MDLRRGNVILYSRYFARFFSLSCSICEDNVQWKKKKKKKKKKKNYGGNNNDSYNNKNYSYLVLGF